MIEELVTEKELCEWLKVSRSSMNKLRKHGLPYIKVLNMIRYSKDDVQEWMTSNRQLVETVEKEDTSYDQSSK